MGVSIPGRFRPRQGVDCATLVAMSVPHLPSVGAPVVEAVLPLQGTHPARFYRWLQLRRDQVREMLDCPTRRWQLLASFVEVNFVHPEVGPAGSLVLTSSTLDPRTMRRRGARLKVIPFRELQPYIPRWEAGETVVVSVGDMPEELARRYATTPIRWSLNVPVRVDDQWVGLVGAATDARGFDQRVISSFEALAQVLMADFAADSALYRFRRETTPGKRFLHLLR